MPKDTSSTTLSERNAIMLEIISKNVTTKYFFLKSLLKTSMLKEKITIEIKTKIILGKKKAKILLPETCRTQVKGC